MSSRTLLPFLLAWFVVACDAGGVRIEAELGPAEDVAWNDGTGSPEAAADASPAETAEDADTDLAPEADAIGPAEEVEAVEAPPEATDADDASDVTPAEVEPTPDVPVEAEPEATDAQPEADVPPVGCVPDDDGVITAAETPVAIGAVVSYRVSAAGQTVAVPDLAGSPCDAGLCWDFSAPLAGDTTEADDVRAVQELWFADRFPADAVVMPIDARTGNLAVYQKTDAGFLMLGMASEQPEYTALVYDPPVTILAFPFQKGSTWQTEEARADGLFEGSVYPDAFGNHVVHAYRFTVNGRGRVTVPAGSFPVLRLLLDLTMEARNAWGVPYQIPGLAETTHVKVYDFLAECIGLVARVRSTDGELATFFNDATEYKRLGF